VERFPWELLNKDMYRPSRGVPEPPMVPRGDGVVYTIPPQGRREFLPPGVPPLRDGGRHVGFGCGEFAGRSFTRGQYEHGGNDRSFRSQRNYEPRSPLRGMHSPPRGLVTTRNRPLQHQIFWQHHVFSCNSWFYSNQRINALRYLGVMATKNVGCVC
jgi:hypothetical protein